MNALFLWEIHRLIVHMKNSDSCFIINSSKHPLRNVKESVLRLGSFGDCGLILAWKLWPALSKGYICRQSSFPVNHEKLSWSRFWVKFFLLQISNLWCLFYHICKFQLKILRLRPPNQRFKKSVSTRSLGKTWIFQAPITRHVARLIYIWICTRYVHSSDAPLKSLILKKRK